MGAKINPYFPNAGTQVFASDATASISPCRMVWIVTKYHNAESLIGLSLNPTMKGNYYE